MLFRSEAEVVDLYVPYVMPQENGGRTDCRRLELTDGTRRLHVGGSDVFQFSAHHFTAGDLYAARHTNELKPRPEVFVTLDHKHCGLGTGSCGPATLQRYRVRPGTYRFSFCFALS